MPRLARLADTSPVTLGDYPALDYHAGLSYLSDLTGRCSSGSVLLALLLGLLCLSGFFGLAASVRPLLLRPIVRVRLLVVVAALATEKEQNLLSVRHNSHCGLVPTAMLRAPRKRRLSGSNPAIVAMPCSSRTLASALPISLVRCELERAQSISTPLPVARAIAPARIAPTGREPCHLADRSASFMTIA